MDVLISHEQSKNICRNCLSRHRSQFKLEEQRITCLDKNAMRYVKHHRKHPKWDKLYEKMPIYLTLYADFECLDIPTENGDQEGNTINISNQRPVNHGLFAVSHLKEKIAH